MANSLGLVSCGKLKKNYRCPAREMFAASDLFKKAYEYAIKHYDCVAILSPKHGLLVPDEEVDPDFTWHLMTSGEQDEWARNVLAQLKSKLPMSRISDVFFHSGAVYRNRLTKLLEAEGIHCVTPLENLGLGRQRAWYLKTP